MSLDQRTRDLLVEAVERVGDAGVSLRLWEPSYGARWQAFTTHPLAPYGYGEGVTQADALEALLADLSDQPPWTAAEYRERMRLAT